MPKKKQIADRAREIVGQLQLEPGSEMALDVAQKDVDLKSLPKEGKQNEKSD